MRGREVGILDWFGGQQLADQISMIGVLIAAFGLLGIIWQLSQQSAQARTTFEDSFDERYRQVIARIPTKALLGETLSEEEYRETFDEFYHYIDLCNEQAFLWKRRRIRRRTWLQWVDGIRGNFSRPAFQRAWLEISSKAEADFSELRQVLSP